MFCDEPIINVYEGRSIVQDNDAFLDCYHDQTLSLHLSEGYRYILETEHFYISLSVEGVSLIQKKSALEGIAYEGESFDEFAHFFEDKEGIRPWIGHEYTLFVGESVVDVAGENGAYLVKFTDFTLSVVPHDDSDEISGISGHYKHHVFGFERLITRPCTCGGKGELVLDFVSDFLVECNRCGVSTYAAPMAKTVIDLWNDGEAECRPA